ncbi:GGGtGRT protein [Dysosmobacter sp.]
MSIVFENFDARKDSIFTFLHANNIDSLEQADALCAQAGLHIYQTVKGIQRICFEDAPWAYTVGAAAALRRGNPDAGDIAATLGQGLQAFCLNGSVAQQRQIGIGHGQLAARVLDDRTNCFCFLAGHESFAAAEGAIGIAMNANKVRQKPLRVILNGLGKDAAEIISRINGFTYVGTHYDFETDQLTVTEETRFSSGLRGEVRCYGANEMREGVAIMIHEGVDVSITGNATNMIKFQHPVSGTYKKYTNDHQRNYFACASGGGIGRTLNVDDISAGPASYGYTDMLSRMYADATFAGSSSVPAHVEMMGFIGMGNNPMVGATVAISVAISESLRSRS